MRPRSRCDREIRLVLTSFLTPTPTIYVKETNLVPEPRRTICLMFDSRRESEADSCLISSEIVLLEPQICRQYCRQLSVFSNPASQSQPSRCDDRNSAQNVCYFTSLAPSRSCKLTQLPFPYPNPIKTLTQLPIPYPNPGKSI